METSTSFKSGSATTICSRARPRTRARRWASSRRPRAPMASGAPRSSGPRSRTRSTARGTRRSRRPTRWSPSRTSARTRRCSRTTTTFSAARCSRRADPTKRSALYDDARVALAKHDVKTAQTKAKAFAQQVSVKQNPFEVRQSHELNGMVALETKQWKTAADELAHANLRDPRVLYLAALALAGEGDAKAAKAMALRAAGFNGLAPDYAYVRAKAKALAK